MASKLSQNLFQLRPKVFLDLVSECDTQEEESTKVEKFMKACLKAEEDKTNYLLIFHLQGDMKFWTEFFKYCKRMKKEYDKIVVEKKSEK